MTPDNFILPKEILYAVQRYLLTRPMGEIEHLVSALRQLERADERTDH